MLTDFENNFSENQVVTTTAVSTNNLSLGKAGQPGEDTMAHLWILVTETLTGNTSLQIEAITADTAGGLSSPTVLGSSQVYPVAALKAGTRLNPPVFPLGTRNNIALRYVVVGTATTGKISAGMNLGVQTNR
jgi:hypothetical protein